MFSPSSSKRSAQSRAGGGTLNKSTVEELSYHLPTNRQRPAPPRRNPSLLHTTQSGATSPSDAMFNNATNLKAKASDHPKRRERSRPNTGNSAYSETFMRPWSWRKPKPVITTMINTPTTTSIASKLSPTRLLSTPKSATVVELGKEEDGGATAPTFWVEEEHLAGNLDKQDVEWQPPTDWDIAGPITGGNITAPAVPMPAFLKPHMPIDPRSIDPSSFPLPAQDQVGPLGGRWSSSQRSSFGHPGGQHLSVGADSMFCTCDLDGIMEEDDEAYHQAFGSSRGHETPRVSMSGSSIHAGPGKCRACMRRSATANAIAMANNNAQQQQPNSPTSTLFSRASSIRKSRRKRKQEISPNSKIAVAGRLYKEG